MDKYRPWSLWLQIALPLLFFVIAGSIILGAWLYIGARNESRAEFATLARTNADFIRTSHLPLTPRMAAELERILGVNVGFRDGQELIMPESAAALKSLLPQLQALDASHGVIAFGAGREAIATKIDDTHALVLVRDEDDAGHLFFRPSTIALLLSFWVLSLVLAWTLTRGVVRPLRVLAQRLPRIESGEDSPLPGLERNDEIGLLARTFAHTRRQLAEERARREQAERLALLGKMATGLAHEINNPVSAIRMHAQLLDASESESVPVILGEAQKIEGLVNQWMFLARPAPPQVSGFDLRGLIAETVKPLLPQARHANVEIRENIPAGICIRADARRIAQAAGNIILNAIQAMPGGGILEITGEAGSQASVSFRDQGRGFSGSALQRYAELFYSEKEGGMGIGLSVTSEVVKAHSGVVEVENIPGGGARVTIRFAAENKVL